MFKNIMVHLDKTTACDNRVDVAIALAKQQCASLTGLYVYASPHQKDTARDLEEVREAFARHTEPADIDTDLVDVDLGFQHVGVAEMIGYYTSFTDLLVISQPLQADRYKQFNAMANPERLLLSTGRPVLIVPQHGHFPNVGQRIMVAWKAGPKASRALHDAIPLLHNATTVNVVSVGDMSFTTDENVRLSRYLERHGVSASVEQLPAGSLSVGNTLLNLVADDNIDLMVMGVHITTRRGQLDMGGVGRFLLDQMTVPILFSH